AVTSGVADLRRIVAEAKDRKGMHQQSTILFLDEIHRLKEPSQLLKIAADHYPKIKILAIGSSVLGATKKFKDTLTGRKRELWLTPMMTQDLEDFKNNNLKHRFRFGGLPPFFLAKEFPERDFQEWMDAYWAKDIQELFRLERRQSFQMLVEMIMNQSGRIFEATRFAKPCEVSRGTIKNYLKVLEATFVAHVIRPFSKNPKTEIVSAPKVYAFDTGFVCYHKGFNELRSDDMGLLWEHFVINEIFAHMQTRKINYWRDKQGHEIDFIIQKRSQPLLAIECKWSSQDASCKNFRIFSKKHPLTKFIVVSRDIDKSFTKNFKECNVSFVSLEDLIKLILEKK
ncbi:ATP-binding protein, partial [PVC group bacterium]|nr:ATP-binding protein [PVC group bacterium]